MDEDSRVIKRKKHDFARQLNRELLGALEDFTGGFEALGGLVVFSGPGSFTGLRIGVTIMNAIAYAENISIVGTAGEDWVETGFKRLGNGENDRIVLPEYGRPANVTKPVK